MPATNNDYQEFALTQMRTESTIKVNSYSDGAMLLTDKTKSGKLMQVYLHPQQAEALGRLLTQLRK